jgi:amino acid transporter
MALALAICVTIGRGYFALGRDGLLPSVFARTSRHNTPWVGNLMVAVGGIGLMLIVHFMNYGTKFVIATPDGIVPLFPNDEFATFIVSATAGSFVIELVYLILAVVAIRLLVLDNAVWWQYLVVLVAIATPVLGFYGALHPSPHDRTNYNWEALYWSLIVVGLSGVWFAVARLMYPDRVRNAAAHAAQHRGVPPLDENVDFTPAPPDTTI